MDTFKQQYQALPGDMNNATTFWGLAGGTAGPPSDVTCSTTASTTTATCNGDGNGLLWWTGATWGETTYFWKHLANAKMIEGSFTGATVGAVYAYDNTPGLNVPLSRFAANAGWWVVGAGNYTGGW